MLLAPGLAIRGPGGQRGSQQETRPARPGQRAGLLPVLWGAGFVVPAERCYADTAYSTRDRIGRS